MLTTLRRRHSVSMSGCAVVIKMGSLSGAPLVNRFGRYQWLSTQTNLSTNSRATTSTQGLISRQRPVPAFITQ